MRVVFLFGPPAAGKYTIGRLVAEKLGVPLFHNHLCVDLVSSLFDFGTKSFVDLREKVWIDSFSEAAKSGTSFVFTFSPESTVLDGMIGRLRKLVYENGGRIDFVELNCSAEVILERISNPERTKFGKLSDPDLYAELNSNGVFEYEMDCEPLVSIDTDELSPEESANLILRALKNSK